MMQGIINSFGTFVAARSPKRRTTRARFASVAVTVQRRITVLPGTDHKPPTSHTKLLPFQRPTAPERQARFQRDIKAISEIS
jgi:hypothetical protein